MVNKYSFQGFKKDIMVRTLGKNLPISKKASREICRFIKGKSIDKAISYLESVEKLEKPVPYLRHRHDVAHRKGKGFGPGRYPIKAAKEIIKLLKSLKAAASNKGLNELSLKIVHASVSPGPILLHYGRYRGTRRKMCNIEIVAEETAKKPKKEKKKSKIKEIKEKIEEKKDDRERNNKGKN